MRIFPTLMLHKEILNLQYDLIPLTPETKKIISYVYPSVTFPLVTPGTKR